MPVARGQVFVNEILEIIYQWHPGAGFKDIRRSLGFDRNIVRTYVKPAQIELSIDELLIDEALLGKMSPRALETLRADVERQLAAIQQQAAALQSERAAMESLRTRIRRLGAANRLLFPSREIYVVGDKPAADAA